MGSVEGRGEKGFHELPLVLFTALATAAGGLGSAHGLLALLRLAPPLPAPGLLWTATLLYGVGLAASTGHLGRPLRAPRALSRLGSSPLSNEVAVVGGAFLLTALSALAFFGEEVRAWLAGASMAAGFLTLLSLGWVYRLPGQLAWRGTAVAHPLVLGTALGLVVHLAMSPDGASSSLVALTGLFLGGDLVLVWRAWRRIDGAQGSGGPSHPLVFRLRGRLVVFRGTLGGVIPLVALLAKAPAPALTSLLAGLILDRFIFYGLAVRWTVESEISRVEGVLEGR